MLHINGPSRFPALTNTRRLPQRVRCSPREICFIPVVSRTNTASGRDCPHQSVQPPWSYFPITFDSTVAEAAFTHHVRGPSAEADVWLATSTSTLAAEAAPAHHLGGLSAEADLWLATRTITPAAEAASPLKYSENGFNESPRS